MSGLGSAIFVYELEDEELELDELDEDSSSVSSRPM
jgi:hypothetical protein